jgi:AbrB family looped-hinge helix DNA binding protein
MREFVSTVTERGQVTIPAEVRRLLGAKPRDKITFRITGDSVHVVPVELTLEQVFGSVTQIDRPEDLEELSRIAKEEKAEQTIRELRSE